mgnify:CR=1
LAELGTQEEGENCISVTTTEASRLHGAFNRCIYDCRERLNNGVSSIIVLRSKDTVNRVKDLFAEENAGIRYVDPLELPELAQNGF